MRGDILHDDATSADLGTFAYFDIADNRSVSADQYAFPNLRMTVSRNLTGTAERDAVQNRHVIFHDGRLANDKAGGVVKHYATANRGGRVNVDTENGADLVLQKERQAVPFLGPEPMGNTVSL